VKRQFDGEEPSKLFVPKTQGSGDDVDETGADIRGWRLDSIMVLGGEKGANRQLKWEISTEN